MASKLIIFVAFASLVQSSLALPSNNSYGLTSKQLASLAQIITNQDATVQAQFDAFDPVFDIIGKYSSALVWNVQVNSDDDSSKVAEALVRAKDAIDYSLDAVLIVLQESCDAVEVARNATYADVDKAYAVATDALELACAGNFSTNRAQLEVYQTDVGTYLSSLISSVYDSIRTCMDTTDSAMLSEIQMAQEGSQLALVHLTNALFSAIKVYATAVTTGTAKVSLIYAVEDFRRHAHASFRSDVEHKFSGLKTIFISTQLNDTAIVSPLGKNQYALTVSFYRFQAEMEIAFSTIGTYLASVRFGIYDDGIVDFSSADAADATASAKREAGDEVFLVSVLSIHPNAISAVAAAKETFATIASKIYGLYHEAIDTAVSPTSDYSESKAIIENLRTSALPYAATAANLYYVLLRNGETWDNDSESAFTNLQEAAPGLAENVVNNIFDAIEIVAQAHYAKEATDDDFAAIATAKNLSVSASVIFTQNLSAAGVIVIKAHQAHGR